MTESPRFPPRDRDHASDDLWRRLARAQDAALANATPQTARQGHQGKTGMSPTRRRRIRGGIVLLAAGAAVTLVAVVVHKAPLRFQAGRTADPGAAGRPLLTDARSDLPLQFSDGSTITFRAGSGGRMQRLTDSGAEVVLERGRLDAHVVHAASTLWLVHAGPFQVRVTGTRFAVGWSAPKLDVAVYEGSVVVEGAPLGAGVPLGAGHRLTIENGVVRTELLGSGPNHPPSTPVAPTPVALIPDVLVPDKMARDTVAPEALTPTRPAAPGPSRDGEWLALAKRGAYAQAHSVAKRLGWRGLCDRLDARRLLMLGDVARYAGAHAEARRAFESLVRRFSDDRLAADAVFSLGRLAFEAERPAQATRWFKRYVRDWPNGPLADQASGRLVECATRLNDRGAARDAARAYLARSPTGPHAHLARDVLGRPTDEPP